MKRAYIYATLHPTKIRESMNRLLPWRASQVLTGMGRMADATFDTRYGNANAKSRKLDIADFLWDAASRNNPTVGAAD